MIGSHIRRLNEGIVQPLERPALQYLAARMPAFVTPDILTTIGFIGACMAAAGYALAQSNPSMLLFASLGLLVNWFGDSLDGTLARFRRIERPTYGFFLDHTTDVFEQVIIAFGMGLSGYIQFEFAIISLIVYLLLSVMTFARSQYLSTLQISYAGFGPTEIRLLLIIMNLLIFFIPPETHVVLGHALTYPNCLSLLWSTLASAVLVSQVLMTMRQLREQEARPLA